MVVAFRGSQGESPVVFAVAQVVGTRLDYFIFEQREAERLLFFFFQAEDGIRDFHVTGVQTLLFRSRLSCRGRGCLRRMWSSSTRERSGRMRRSRFLPGYRASREAVVRRLLVLGKTTEDFYRRKRGSFRPSLRRSKRKPSRGRLSALREKASRPGSHGGEHGRALLRAPGAGRLSPGQDHGQ